MQPGKKPFDNALGEDLDPAEPGYLHWIEEIETFFRSAGRHHRGRNVRETPRRVNARSPLSRFEDGFDLTELRHLRYPLAWQTVIRMTPGGTRPAMNATACNNGWTGVSWVVWTDGVGRRAAWRSFLPRESLGGVGDQPVRSRFRETEAAPESQTQACGQRTRAPTPPPPGPACPARRLTPLVAGG